VGIAVGAAGGVARTIVEIDVEGFHFVFSCVLLCACIVSTFF
jgi:hypothetical protein